MKSGIRHKKLLRAFSITMLLLLSARPAYAQEMPVADFDEIPTMEGNTISGPTASITEDDEIEVEYYEATPSGEMAKEGPMNVSPEHRPAAQYVVVQKNSGADTKSAQLVAAERAVALGRYDSALKIYEILESKNGSEDARILMGKAICLQKLERFDEAMQVYEKVSERDPKNTDVKLNMLGLLATRYPSVALRRLIDLHNDHADNVGIVAQLAFTYARVGDQQSAINYLGIAASMEPRNANHIYNMGVIYDQAGETAKAIKLYEEALEIDTLYGSSRTIPREVVFERLAQIR